MDLSEDDLSSPHQRSLKPSRPTVLDDSDEESTKDSSNPDGVQTARKHRKVLLEDSDDGSRHSSDAKQEESKQKSFLENADESSHQSLQNQNENSCSSLSSRGETSHSSVTNHDDNSHSSIVKDDDDSHLSGQKSQKKKRKQRIDDSDDESSRSSHMSSNSTSSHHSKRQRLDSSSRDSMRPDQEGTSCVVSGTPAPGGDDSDEDTPLVLYSQPTEEEGQGTRASLGKLRNIYWHILSGLVNKNVTSCHKRCLLITLRKNSAF